MHAPDSRISLESTPSDEAPAAASDVVPWSRRFWPWALLIAVVTLVVYARLYTAEFVEYDDHENITFNEYLNPPSWSGLVVFWAAPYRGMYVPVAYTFLAGESWLAQRSDADGEQWLDPGVFHAGNVLLHALSAVLVFAVLRWLVADGVAAALAALFFALHPVQVEAVSWVTEVRGMLCGVFSMWAILEYLRFLGPPEISDEGVRQESHRAARWKPGWRHYVIACGAYLLALLSKPSAASVPLMLLAIETLYYRRSVWGSVGRLAWWSLPAILLAVLTRQLQDENVAQYVFEPAWWQRPFLALDAMAFYLWKLLVPVGLAVDHGRSPQQVLSEWWVYVVWLVPIALLILCAWLPSRRVWLTAAAIFVAGILPVSGLMSFTFQDLSTVAERYVYLAMLGPAFAGAWLLSRPPCLRWRSEMSLVLVLLALCTVRQTGFWNDTQTLFAHGLDVNPDSTLCLTAVAMRHVEEQDFKSAETLLLHVAEVNPREANVWKNLGALYLRQERPDDAARALERAVELHGSKVGPKMDLALLCLQQQNYERAMQLLREVLEVEPDFTPAHTYMGAALVNQGRHAEAIEHWQAVVSAAPQNVEMLQMLGESLAQAGQYQKALEQFRLVLEVRPGDPRATEFIRLLERQPPGDRSASP